MSKIAINNEIVLMRQAVRQSRVGVLRKLIKEIKLLKARKHGDEKIIEKSKRKAERLAAEIASVKKIKDDEITKFAIIETGNLQQTLGDPEADAAKRIMARLANHKILRERVSKFKEKFPVYEQYLGPGRKKMSKLERKAGREARNEPSGIGEALDPPEHESAAAVDEIDRKDVKESSDDDDSADVESEDEQVDESAHSDEETDDETEQNHSEPESILRVEEQKSPSKKRKNRVESPPVTTEPAEQREKSKKAKFMEKTCARSDKAIPIKVISEEATVKRFTDLIEEMESAEVVREPDEEATKVRKNDVEIEKQVDSFFITENGESEYMSVVVPKQRTLKDEEEEEDVSFARDHAAQRRKNFHERNNKFFSKIDEPRRNGSDGRFNSNFTDRRINVERNGRDQRGKFPRKDLTRDKSRGGKADFERKINLSEEELHPSWAARKKQQEMLKQGFQGKKIVFDD